MSMETSIIYLFLLLPLFGCGGDNGDDPDPDPGDCEPLWSIELGQEVMETSGLLIWDNNILTHNDSEDTRLYILDSNTGEIKDYLNLPGQENNDWEDLAQDEEYVYLGDFGNNADGARTDLHILKISKTSLKAGDPDVEAINFYYEGREHPEPLQPNITNFDCEAMMSWGDSLYIFTKQWQGGESVIYALPKTAGFHVADSISSLQVDGLITGATASGSGRKVVLCGYTILLEPFLVVLDQFPGPGPDGPEFSVIPLSLTFHQVEGIDSEEGRIYYLSSELLNKPPYPESPAKLHLFDLEESSCN